MKVLSALLLFALLASCDRDGPVQPSVSAPAAPLAGGEIQELDEGDQVRFVFFAVLEGLYRDGIDRKVIKGILDAPDPGYFVHKCPICDPVRTAFKLYLTPTDGVYDGMLVDPRAAKPPPDDLKSSDRKTRLKGLERLIARYVEARFKALKMSPGEQAQMKKRLAEGKELGMRIKAHGFGDSCANCDGANAWEK